MENNRLYKKISSPESWIISIFQRNYFVKIYLSFIQLIFKYIFFNFESKIPAKFTPENLYFQNLSIFQQFSRKSYLSSNMHLTPCMLNVCLKTNKTSWIHLDQYWLFWKLVLYTHFENNSNIYRSYKEEFPGKDPQSDHQNAGQTKYGRKWIYLWELLKEKTIV